MNKLLTDQIIVLILALLWDALLGEPPNLLHPVVWMGRIVEVFKRFAPTQNKAGQLIYGLVGVLLAASLVFGLTDTFVKLLQFAFDPIRWIIEAFLLKGCFSLRMLAQAGLKITKLIKAGDITTARFEMRSLVSRNTETLSQDLILAAAIESVAENTTDSFVSPLIFYALFGLPGAMLYRLVNTFDSMVGYRGRYEYLGKAAARLDDILNFIPARITTLLLILNAPLYNADIVNAVRIAVRDHNHTASPNAGWTMAAIAGALHVRLEKVGHYKLGDIDAKMSPALVNQTVMAMYLVALDLCLVYVLVLWL